MKSLKHLTPSNPTLPTLLSRDHVDVKNGPKAVFPSSHSMPHLTLYEAHQKRPKRDKLKLSSEENSNKPYYSTANNGLIQIKDEFLAEAMKEWGYSQNHYLSDEQRVKYKFTNENGIYKNIVGAIHGIYLYVLMSDDRLYGSAPSRDMFHSYLSSGLNVKGAGVIYSHYGQIITISNESGHYKPTLEEMLPGLKLLAARSSYPLIFEDHSHLDNSLPNKGVAHYRVNLNQGDVELVRINSSDELKNLITTSMALAETHIKMLTSKISEDKTQRFVHSYSEAELIGIYYEDDDNDIENFQTISPDSYLMQTCLWRMGSVNSASRFLGKLNVKQGSSKRLRIKV